jgi:protoporphyrinogen oxidase
MSARSPVVILGAGLTGLSAAAHLDAPYRILEKEQRVGGHCITVDDEGYRFDRTGHLLHLRDQSIRDWIVSLLGDELVTVQRRSRIWSHRRYTRYPFQANTYGLPPEVAKACLLGYLEARDAARDAATSEPANFEEFILKTMGRGIADHFMIPYNTKLWGVEPREMSTAWTDRFVPTPSVEDVVAGAVGCHDKELGYNAEFLYPRQGIGALATAIAGSIQNLERGIQPTAIDLAKRRVELSTGESIAYDRIITTIPLDLFLSLVTDLTPQIAARARELRCTSLWYLDVALNRPVKRDLHWIYVPEETYPFYRVGAYSNFSEGLTPRGCGSMYIELASRETPDVEALTPTLVTGLTEMGLIDGAADIAFIRPRHLPHAYVIYDHFYTHATSAIHQFLSRHGVISCGRYGAWEYSAMEDALLSGRNAAARIQTDRTDSQTGSAHPQHIAQEEP